MGYSPYRSSELPTTTFSPRITWWRRMMSILPYRLTKWYSNLNVSKTPIPAVPIPAVPIPAVPIPNIKIPIINNISHIHDWQDIDGGKQIRFRSAINGRSEYVILQKCNYCPARRELFCY